MNLKELSAILGLSQTTVSRALNDYPEVNENTRTRVKKMAKKHNYRPNTRAKGLATGRTLSIGHVMPMSVSHEMVNPIFSDFIAGAGEVYAQTGYDLHLSVVPDLDEEKLYRALATRGAVDGVIVHGPKVNDRRIRLLQEVGLPFVVHGRAGSGKADYSWVDVNNARAFARATKFLTDLGHRRIALINGLEELDFARRRREGYVTGLQDAGYAIDPGIMFSDDMTEGFGYRSAMRCMALGSKPTAFLVSSMIMAIGVRRALAELGLKIPRDVSVVIYDDELSYLQNGDDVPIFTSTRSSVREAGRASAKILMEIIGNPSMPPHQKMLEAELTLGESTGPCR